MAATTGLALLVGALIDGIPESAASAGAMREEGRSRGYIIGVWTGVAVVCVLATIAGYRSWLTIRPSRKPVSSAKTLPGTKAWVRRIARPSAPGRGSSRSREPGPAAAAIG